MTKYKSNKIIDLKRILLSVIWFIVIAIILWMILFHLAEWRTYFNSLYFTVITFSTIGYGDITPLTHFGKVVAMVYALLWVPLFVWITSVVMELRFKKFVFHHFERNKNSLKRAEAQIKKELQEEEFKTAKQSKEIKKIEKKLNKQQKHSYISSFLKKIKLKK